MQRYALIVDDRVHEIVEVEDGVNIADCFHESMKLVPAGASEVGWKWDGKKLVSPAKEKASNADLAAYAKSVRDRVELGGIAYKGMSVKTDDRSKLLIQGSRQLAEAAPEKFETPWFDKNGKRVNLDAESMIDLSNKVAIHVTSCFLVFSDVIDEIETGSITTAAQIDSAPWPKNAG